jgi:hypothetical protein
MKPTRAEWEGCPRIGANEREADSPSVKSDIGVGLGSQSAFIRVISGKIFFSASSAASGKIQIRYQPIITGAPCP